MQAPFWSKGQLLGIALAGYALSVSAGPAAAEMPAIVKIGVLTDMSGSTSDSTGIGSVTAARLAVEDFGGKIGGVPVEVVFADHLNKPDVGASIARQWVDRDGVAVIADLPYTQIAIAAVEIAKQKDRAALIASAASSDLTGKFCSPVSTHWVDDTYALSAGTARALTKAGKKDWFFVTADYAFGHALQRDATAAIEAEGGRVLGSVKHPLPSPDMASYILRANASGAKVVGLANVGSDTINAIKQAGEFGLADQGQTVAALLAFISDVHSLGLKTARGLVITEGFYWDSNDASRRFADRFRKVTNKAPTKPQAAVYASVRHWLKAVEATKSISGVEVTKAMKSIPVEYHGQAATIRPDGRVLYDLTVYEVKSPEESKAPWDYYKPIATVPRDQAFRSLAEGGCQING